MSVKQDQSAGAPAGDQPTEVAPTETQTEKRTVFAPPHFSADPTTWGEDISPDKNGLLFKKVLRPGYGEDTPLKGDKVYVHYEGRLLDQTQFDSSKGEDVPFEVNIGLGQVVAGWDIGIVTMNKGEICVLTCLPKMAYGGEEFQDTIPPDSTLQFEIELISWHGMYCTKDPGGPEVNVLKSFIKEGDKSGTKVKDSAEVTVNIIGKFEDRVFFKKENFTFSIDECDSYKLPSGIEHGIKKMKKEEIGRIYIPPIYGFGRAGNLEFNIPPSANLVYEVDLISFNNLKESWEYDTIEERLDAATKFKTRGTELFKSEQFSLAMRTYEKGFSIVDPESLEKEEKLPTKPVRLALKLNISLCQSKMHKFSAQYRNCSEILEEDPVNVKALFRRGMAGIEISEYVKAISDFDRVLQLEPDNKGAIKLKEHAKSLLKGQNDKEKRLYTSVFNKMFAGPDPNSPKDIDDPKEDDPKGDSIREDIPKQDAPKEDPPKEDVPKQEAPKEDPPKEDAPKEDPPKEDPPKEDVPKQEAPKEDPKDTPEIPQGDGTKGAGAEPESSEGATADA